MRNFIALLFIATCVFAAMGVLQVLPESVQTVLNQKASEFVPKKIAIVEAQHNYLKAAEEAGSR